MTRTDKVVKVVNRNRLSNKRLPCNSSHRLFRLTGGSQNEEKVSHPQSPFVDGSIPVIKGSGGTQIYLGILNHLPSTFTTHGEGPDPSFGGDVRRERQKGTLSSTLFGSTDLLTYLVLGGGGDRRRLTNLKCIHSLFENTFESGVHNDVVNGVLDVD